MLNIVVGELQEEWPTISASMATFLLFFVTLVVSVSSGAFNQKGWQTLLTNATIIGVC